MPGISLTCNLGKKDIKSGVKAEQLFLSALDSATYNESYKRKILLEEDNYMLGSTIYPEYPVKTIDIGKFWVCIEGRIYGKQNAAVSSNELDELLNCIFSYRSGEERNRKVIIDWLLQTDGEFVIFALNKKTKDFAIINDVLGRLPLYYHYVEEKEIIISRELQFILYLTQNRAIDVDRFDRMGIAQFLLFRHPVGSRTLLRNISRIEPGTLVTICNKNSEVKIESLYRFNFDKQEYASDTIKRNAENLVSLFSEACRKRANYGNKNIISLSGGLDSRAVAACFHLNKIPCYASSRIDHSWTPSLGKSPEADIAKKVASLFKIEWKNFDFIKPTAEDLVMLLNIKHGSSYLAFSFLLPFLDELKHEHGSSALTIFTGHGGDIILADLTPKKKIKNIDDLISRIIRGRGFFSLSEIAALTEVKETEIVNELKHLLASYPENDLNRKYIHYLFYEIDFKFGFESEDINRFYFWSVSPFYAIPFFYYAVNCASRNKSQHNLYREFLMMLSPSAAAISNSNWGCSILSKKYKFLQFILSLTFRYRILRRIMKRIKDNHKGYTRGSRIIRCITYQINNCNAIANYLSRSKIERIVNNPSEYNRVGIDNLFTVTSLIEKNRCDNGSIEKYYGDST
jgi:asparagine synthase (glutamine-hydrolysing)